MMQTEAQRRNASAERFRHSQSLASRLHRLNQPIIRSTIHSFGNTTNLWRWDLDDFQENSGKTSYGSGGVDNISHLQAFKVMRHLGAEAVHMPYRGTAAVLTDTALGNVQFVSDAFNTALPLACEGLVRPIAVFTLKRVAQLPDSPIMAESDLLPPGSDTGIWLGILAPAKTPPTAIARLNAAVNTALPSEEVTALLAGMGA